MIPIVFRIIANSSVIASFSISAYLQYCAMGEVTNFTILQFWLASNSSVCSVLDVWVLESQWHDQLDITVQ